MNNQHQQQQFLFVNKTKSSDVLTRSSASDKSRILSHVQTKRRKGEAQRKKPWLNYTSAMTVHDESVISDGQQNQNQQQQHQLLTPPQSQAQVDHTASGTAQPPTGKKRAPPRRRHPPTPPPPPPAGGQVMEPPLTVWYPAHNASDPFFCTAAGADADTPTHALLNHAFVVTNRNIFLSEALAPPAVVASRPTMRHDRAIEERLRSCVDDRLMMYATLGYGAACLAWMFGSMDEKRPPEYFIGKAIPALRARIDAAFAEEQRMRAITPPDTPESLPGGDENERETDNKKINSERNAKGSKCKGGKSKSLSVMLAIHALAITQLWNDIPQFWIRCKPRYEAISKLKASAENGVAAAAARTHMNALYALVEQEGGWGNIDAYALENCILAEKYLSMYEGKPPVMSLSWDPGPMPEPMQRELGILHHGFLPDLGERLAREPIRLELRAVVLEVVDYVRVASLAWARAERVSTAAETWLFRRGQVLICKLLKLQALGMQGVDLCVLIATDVFLLNASEYHGGQVRAKGKTIPLRNALSDARFWSKGFSPGLRFWCFCLGAVVADPPGRNWFVGMVTHLARMRNIELTVEAFEYELVPYLFLPNKQREKLAALVKDVSASLKGVANQRQAERPIPVPMSVS